MAKTVGKAAAKTDAAKEAKTKSGDAVSGGMKNFEERIERLEELGDLIRKPDIPLDRALASFEEGIKLARSLEKDLEKIESRIEILMSSTEAPPEESPELELFDLDQ